jgi:hypothetical protein
MKGWHILGGVVACAALIWGAQREWQVLGSMDGEVENPAPSPVYRAEGYQPSPLPSLGGVDSDDIARPMPTDAPVIAAQTLRPTTFHTTEEPGTAPGDAPAKGHPKADEPPVLGSIRMPTDPGAFGATGDGFVPVGGTVPQAGPAEHVPTLDLTDPEELAFKREAGDLQNPVDEEEQIKRNAHGDSLLDGTDTTLAGPPSPSAQEHHANGVVADPNDASDSAKEVHQNGQRPELDWRAAGLSPTEANVVEVPDLTNTTLANAPPPPARSETWVEDPVPTWDGPGTLTDDP